MIIEGAISVKAAIANHKRTVKTVYIDKNKKTKDFNYLRKISKENNIEIKEIEREAFADLNVGKSFGGVVCEASLRKYDKIDSGDVFYLDGLEDPFNMGYIIRTLYAFGIKNIMLPLRDYSSFEAQLLKSSAGAYDMANVELVEKERIEELKKQGYTVYALKRGDDATDVFDEYFPSNTLMMLGGEKRGISANLLALADKFLYIPYGSDFRNSLSGVSACDVVATLMFKQRK